MTPGLLLDAVRRRPVPTVLLLTAATLVAGFLQRRPCHTAGWPDDYAVVMGRLCYSDIPLLYRHRAFHTGDFPFAVSHHYETLEYPVLTGLVADAAARLARWWHVFRGGVPPDVHAASVTFYEVSAVLLFVCGVLVTWLTARVAGRPWQALMVAVAPSLALTSLINFDLVAVLLTALAIAAWASSAPLATGVFLGLGVSAKLYPLLLLGPLFLLCLRAGRLRAYTAVVAGCVVTWTAVNLPVALTHLEGWSWFWLFNQRRQGEFGSVWYLFALAGDPVDELNRLSVTLFALACAAIAVLAVRAPRRPRVAQLGFLVIAAFLVVNKVYSPQYVLWLLPFAVLARPNWRDWAIWQAAEVGYWAAVWLHIGMYLGSAGWWYDVATLCRVAATLYLAGMVVRDVLHPQCDAGRRHGEDPAGGLLVGRPDALPSWLAPRQVDDARQAVR